MKIHKIAAKVTLADGRVATLEMDSKGDYTLVTRRSTFDVLDQIAGGLSELAFNMNLLDLPWKED